MNDSEGLSQQENGEQSAEGAGAQKEEKKKKKKKKNKKKRKQDAESEFNQSEIVQNQSITIDDNSHELDSVAPSPERDEDFNPLKEVLSEGFYEDQDSSEDEGMPDYKIGGYHPIHVGEILLDRYVII